MKRLFVKICGLCSRNDVERVASFEPDALGFVFWKGSKRCVEPDKVRDWTRDIPPRIRKVGVFVDESSSEVAAVVNEAGLDIAQLHGSEEAGDFGSAATSVWKVVRVGGESTAERCREADAGYRVDAFLIDSYSADSPGGTGITCNWQRAREFVLNSRVPVILAGGLTPSNVVEAVRQVEPWGVDVSSGVELRPGVKDMERISDFIKECRRCEKS